MLSPDAKDHILSSTKSTWNVWAVVGFAAAFILPPASIVLGAVGLQQIRRTGQRGHDLALAGIIVSLVFIAIGIFSVLAYGVPHV